MAGRKFLALMLAAGAAAAAAAWPAEAQCRLCDKPTTARGDSSSSGDVELEIQSGINFDKLVLVGDGLGQAVIRPDGSSTAAGIVANVSPRAMVGTAVVHGEPGRTIRVELPPRIELYSLTGARITFDDVASDLPTVPRLDATGMLSFRFGGRVTITGEADGQFRGELPITVEYQ